MKTNKIKNWILAGATTLIVATSCDVDPSFYSQVVPETFYTSQDAVWERFNRPFTHWRWWVAQDRARWELQELGTDEICVPTRGSDWYNGAIYQKFHHHEYTEDMTSIETGWTNFSMGVALAWDAAEDLEGVDFDALGFEAGTRESMMNQLNTLVASFYLDGLDFFGGVPLYKTTKSDVLPRSTAEETFNFIDSLLQLSTPELPVKTELGAMETNVIHQAVGAVLRARLYFNAESYIGKPMYNEAAEICQDILDGKYGKYALATDWTSIFGFRNETCPEIIWTVPSENAKLETDGGYWGFTVPYNFKDFLGGLKDSGSDNGCCLLPSRDPQGNLYQFNLSNNYEGFNDKDVRKQQYVYESGGKYRGMFVVGEMVNPDHPEWICTGAREYIGKPLLVRDQISYFAKLGTDYATEADLPSTVGTAEENSGVRLIKFSPRPNQDEYKEMFNPDIPIIRLAEVYYMLAECKMRNGDKQGAADLINTVRKRYFEGGNDPDPVTASNLDKYRMLKEWKLEFLGEGRRRTDLVRWNAYVTEDWWDHKATNNPDLNRFPLHYSIIGANNLLEQNPGY
ncbi:RagB/SusD family nutrient uptake outer membrane protein [Parabacteroides sp. AGMB00274]|uniref:RagB/SusD family nutrient uptake outer membrane protein n=1 Tax=Parabacteroides faecalis TaxID=2924040 RepID=A0ABT0C2Y9_9BACT|nr:RagB/SusD family nutrient uptake outer membrane protein [Parabacteroides faecalis]MCI7359383.1 RagB/SusD family nutrient uptake outer membrane protein [Parabacteroides sp.]MCJ2381371.1 RagB/SusD family nutrient uptake outer membrane protein [Parabacteroides faecalis]